MRNKQVKNNVLLLMPKYGLFLIFSFLSLNNCIIEIPFVIFKGKLAQNKLSTEKDAIISSNSLLLSNINIGSNDQPFNLILDTGSYITWVPKYGSKDKYSIEKHYNPSISTTSYNTTNSFVQEFSTGNCTGFFFTDNVKYLENNFLLRFGVAEKTFFKGDGAHGIIGLAHYYQDEKYSFINTLKENKIIDSKMFSLKFKEDILVGTKGTFILGKHSDFSNKNIVTCPLIQLSGLNNKFWACKMSLFGVKGEKFQQVVKQNHDIIFDTGSDSIFIPSSFYRDLHGISESPSCSIYIDRDKSFRYSCSYENRFDFIMTINGKTFLLPKDLFFYKYEYEDGEDYHYITYYSKVIFHENKCILGIPFFYAFHTLFDKDNEKMHFYPENENYIIQYKEPEGKEKEVEYTKIIESIIVAMLILGFIICIIYRIRKVKREKEEASMNQLLKY